MNKYFIVTESFIWLFVSKKEIKINLFLETFELDIKRITAL